MLGRSGRVRQACRMLLYYSAVTHPIMQPSAAALTRSQVRRARRSRSRMRRTGTPAGGSRTTCRCPNPHGTATAYPVLPCCGFGEENAPLDTACTNHMRNSSAGFSKTKQDSTKVYLGSRTCKAESKGTYATVPDILCRNTLASLPVFLFKNLHYFHLN